MEELKSIGKSGVFVIGELSANHNGNFDLAVKTIEALAKTGADAVKVQTFKPESLTLNLRSGHFAPKTDGLWRGYTPWELYSEAAMPYEWQPKLKEIAEQLGLVFFSSPFDFEAVDFLESIGNPIYKIASFEITDIPLIRYAAAKGKPMIISTGVAEIEDIELALKACRDVGNNDITLLKCTSQYPATIEQANLKTMSDLKQRFTVNVGVSDHTMGSLVPVVAVALGATVVEKHFILNRNLGGVDSTFSMEPDEFKEMVITVRNVEMSLGNIDYEVNNADRNRRRSLFVVKEMKRGEEFTMDNVRSLRPGVGLLPKHLESVIGCVATKDIKIGTPVDWDLLR